MTIKKKLGFKGQWVEAFGVGRQVGLDGQGKKVPIDVTSAMLNAIAGNYDVSLHEPPAVIGHPDSDGPAYGWISGVRVNGDKLELQFSDVEPQFEQMVRDGRFKKRSLKLYVDPATAPGGKAPSIRHCAFLGAEPPAVKGLKNIHFSEDEGESIAVDVEGDITFSEGAPMDKELDKTIKDRVAEFLKEKFGISKDEKTQTASFSEADAQTLIDRAVAAAELKFSETLKERDTKIEELETKVARHSSSSARAEILSFCESNLQRVLPAFKEMGLVQFMEMLTSIEDSADTKVTVISFSESDNKNVETKIRPIEWFKNFVRSLPPFIQFGEGFDHLKVTGDASQIIDPKRMAAMREAAGITEPAAKS
jgi:hypothetical protein